MTDTLVLTPAEKEMIEIKRKQAELEAQEKALKMQAERERSINRQKVAAQEWLAKHKKQNGHAEFFFNEMNKAYPGQYKLVTEARKDSFDAYDYISDRELADHKPIGIMNGNRDVYFEQPVNAVVYKIQHIASGRNIDVRTKPGVGYCMYEEYEHRDNAGCRRVKTMHEKIMTKYQAQQFKQTEAQKQEERKNNGPVLAKVLHPDAKSWEYNREYHSYGYRYNRGRESGYYTETVKITFENGLVLEYGIDHKNGEHGVVIQLDLNRIMPNKIENKKAVIDALKNIK